MIADEESEDDVEYVYEKPVETKKSHKKLFGFLTLIVVMVLVVYFLYANDFIPIDNYLNDQTNKNNQTHNQTYIIDNQTYVIPPEYKGEEALNYIRKNYSTSLTEAEDLCINQFNGEWVDDSERVGCYNMKGFLVLYCITENVQELISLCNTIEGNSSCSSTEVSCTLK